MYLSQIYLANFRNFSKNTFEFHESLTLILGENAHGKTSLLEGVYFSSYGHGFRESKEEELLKWETDQGLVEVLYTGEQKEMFQIALRHLGQGIEKRYFVNKTQKSYYQYAQFQKKAVLFAPENILIVIGSPDIRREYLNKSISAYDIEYQKKLRNYENALRKRNKILEIHHNSPLLGEELLFWNQYLEEQATYITQRRDEFMNYLNNHPQVSERIFRIEYHKNEFTKERLLATSDEERRRRRTRIGPHKDDFTIYLMQGNAEENVHLYGSRSQQRLAVFWLKLNEISMLEKQFKVKPVLLLDDIFSELDTHNKKLVLDVIGNYQTIATSTESELPELTKLPKSVIEL